MTRVVTSLINDIPTDQRVLKQVDVLKEMGCNITVVCRRRTGMKINIPGLKTFRMRFVVNHGPLFYLFYNLRLLFYLAFHRFDMYIANDLDTLLPNFIVSKLRRKPLVYDAHEYFTGQFGLEEHRFAYSVWKRIERWIIPGLKYMITVNNSIACLYNEEYGVSPVVVRNMAWSAGTITAVERKDLGIDPGVLLVVIQGTGLNQGRGLPELIEALKITPGVHLLVIGSGDAISEIRKRIDENDLAGHVTILPNMPWPEMIRFTKTCDAGISLDKPVSINQRLSLPNKLFDYISSGIPVIASALPEISAIIERYGCGMTVDEVSPSAVAEALIKLRDNRDLLALLKKNAGTASGELTWEREREKEAALFRKAIQSAMRKNDGK